MRIAIMVACAAFPFSQANATPLSAADREALIESIEALSASAEARVDSRFQLAINAYRQAISSNDAANEFYVKCIEKVNFEDQQRKSSDFRDWRRKEADRLASLDFRLALRYQLRWLILTLQASSAKADPATLAANAREIVDSLFQDAEKLKGQGEVLNQSVTSTVFASAYGIEGLQNGEWPLSPLLLEGIYENVLLPPLRSPDTLDALRATWAKRIQQESIAAETFSQNERGRRNGQAPPSPESLTDQFNTEVLPELKWQMEMDMFRSGDESGASRRMLTHLENHITHKSARKWGDELKQLLGLTPVPSPTAEAGRRAGT